MPRTASTMKFELSHKVVRTIVFPSDPSIWTDGMVLIVRKTSENEFRLEVARETASPA